MASLLAFTDACPQESIDTSYGNQWYTLACVGIAIDGPIVSPIIAPRLGGAAALFRLPDPTAIAQSLQRDAKDVLRSWKRIRGAKRREKALERLLEACRDGKCVLFSHSTLSQFAEGILDRYVAGYCGGFVHAQRLIGRPEYLVDCTPFGPSVEISRRQLVSLNWLVHSLRIILQKAREALGNVEALFVHDNLPFNRPDEVAVVRALLNALDPGRVHFMTERDRFEFVPSDNLAGATHAFVSGKDPTIQQWIWRNERPRGFYMTTDEYDGTFKRFI